MLEVIDSIRTDVESNYEKVANRFNKTSGSEKYMKEKSILF